MIIRIRQYHRGSFFRVRRQLAAVGILPKGWQKALSAAGAVIVIVNLFE